MILSKAIGKKYERVFMKSLATDKRTSVAQIWPKLNANPAFMKNPETLLTHLVQLLPKESANEVSKKIECIYQKKIT